MPKLTHFRRRAAGNLGYQTKPSHAFDPGRFARGRPAWVKPNADKKEKNKILILPDWVTMIWSDEKRSDVINALGNLITPGMNGLDEGFDLYLRTADQLIKLTKDNLSLLKRSYQGTMESPKAIIDMAHAHLKLTADDVHILDDYWINYLLDKDDQLKPRLLSLHDYHELAEKKIPILDYLHDATPSCEGFVIDFFSYDTPGLYHQLIQQFPKAIPSKDYRFVRMGETELSTFINTGVLEIEPFILSLSDLINIEHFQIKGDRWSNASINATCIDDFLLKTPTLKTLDLSYCGMIAGAFSRIAPNSLAMLETLILTNSSISADGLIHLLKAAPHLKILDLSYCNQLDGVFSCIDQNSLAALETLKLENNYKFLILDDLIAMLKAAPNLKTLDLSRCNTTTGAFLRSAKNSLAMLETLNLSDSDITHDDLIPLLQAAPNLKTLDLSVCNRIAGEFSNLAPNDLQSLETLMLRGSVIIPYGLFPLLQAAPNIKTLDLSMCKMITGAFLSAAPNGLKALETLTLRNSSITPVGLIHLLKAAPNLKTLDLSECKMLDGAYLGIEPNGLKTLETLELGYSTITPEGLIHLLKAAPNLKTLVLSDSHTIAGASLSLDLSDLAMLETLTLIQNTVNPQNLFTLLKAAPNIKTLDLTFCKMIAGTFSSLAPNGFATLETLMVAHNDITCENLITLLEATPHLKTLDLTNCSITDLFLSLDPNGLATLEHLKLKHDHITCENLSALFEVAPNLKTLDLSYCTMMAGASVRIAPNALAALEMLNLDNSTITPEDLITLLEAAPNLKILRASYCELLSLECIEALKIRFPLVEVSCEPNALKIEASPVAAPKVDSKADFKADSYAKQWIDADTSPIKHSYDLKRIFYPIGSGDTPDVTLYRRQVFQGAGINHDVCQLSEAFYQYQEGELNLKRCAIQNNIEPLIPMTKPNAHLYYGKQSLEIGPEWQALASLSPNEKMQRYHTEPEVAVDIKYSERDNLYYISSKTKQKITIDFSLQVPDKQESSLPADIEALANDIKAYTAGALTLNDSPKKGVDYLATMLVDKKGSCRHRALVFKLAMNDAYPNLPVRIVTNDCHAFVEVHYQDAWHMINLGGYPSNLHISEDNKSNLDVQKLAHYKQALATWKRAEDFKGNISAYCQSCVRTGDVNNRLIECQSTHDVYALSLALQAHCKETQRPVFYVDSPDDLITAAPYLQYLQHNQGKIQPGPGGALFEFLRTNPNGVLVVNYEHFDADDIVRYNALLDEIRKTDNTLLPLNTVVIGLTNLNSPTCYQGSDFYSRFGKNKEACPFSSHQLAEGLPTVSSEYSKDQKTPVVMNLFYGADWKERLLGTWQPRGDGLFYDEGVLEKAFAEAGEKGVIEIQNGLWDNQAFVHFWQKAQRLGFIEHGHKKISVPAGLTLLQRKGYDWDLLIKKVQFTVNAASQKTNEHFALNPQTFNELFSRFSIDNGTKQYHPLPGLIAEARGQVLPIYLTRSLDEDDWARMLTACCNENVTLSVSCAPGVVMPPAIASIAPGLDEENKRDGQNASPNVIHSHTRIIQSSDIDTTVAMERARHPGSLVIDVSELSGSDILQRIDATLNEDTETPRLEFSEHQCAIARALDEENSLPIILKGNFSAELADSLANFLLKRQTNPKNLRPLILINENNLLNYLKFTNHQVSPLEKRSFIAQQYPAFLEKIEPYLGDESLSQLQARCDFLTRNNDSTVDADSNNAWVGFSHLAGEVKQLASLNTLTSAVDAAEFEAKRDADVQRVLTTEPYVYLAGRSGVGKSTSVMKLFDKEPYQLFHGESAMKEWATGLRSPNKKRILFLDEVNLSPREWRDFEGLFEHPPHIVINGDIHPLIPSDDFKVVFAANPTNYSDDRYLGSFFKRHGHSVLFEPLPMACLYERVLKPILETTDLAAQTDSISDYLLRVYNFFYECSSTDVLISPRELQMMALLTISYCKSMGRGADVALAMQHSAYEIAKHLVPPAYRHSFDEQFLPKAPLPSPPEAVASRPLKLASGSKHEFYVTPSRAAIQHCLDEMLTLRAMRQTSEDPAVRFGGLGGLVIEGDPGTGKSELVIETLTKKYHYDEVHDLSKPIPSSDMLFYRMPVSLDPQEKTKQLLQAFHAGIVVVIDEINSSPMLEALLNELLMGSYQGKHPQKAGFMVIGTQNPVTMAGRRLASTALSRRLINLDLPSYTEAEVLMVLEQRQDLPPYVDKKLLAKAYQENVVHAKNNQLSPAPTFRDLINYVDELCEAHRKANSKQRMEVEQGVNATAIAVPVCSSSEQGDPLEKQDPLENAPQMPDSIQKMHSPLSFDADKNTNPSFFYPDDTKFFKSILPVQMDQEEKKDEVVVKDDGYDPKKPSSI